MAFCWEPQAERKEGEWAPRTQAPCGTAGKHLNHAIPSLQSGQKEVQNAKISPRRPSDLSTGQHGVAVGDAGQLVSCLH